MINDNTQGVGADVANGNITFDKLVSSTSFINGDISINGLVLSFSVAESFCVN